MGRLRFPYDVSAAIWSKRGWSDLSHRWDTRSGGSAMRRCPQHWRGWKGWLVSKGVSAKKAFHSAVCTASYRVFAMWQDEMDD